MDSTELALRLSYDLDGVTDREAFLDAVTASLEAIFPSESLGWVGFHPATGALEIRGTGDANSPGVVDAVSRNMYRHPQVLSYTSTSSMQPRRISDIVGDRDWFNHPVFAEAFAPWHLRTQLSIVVTPVTPNSWNGWAVNRARQDFSDAEVDTANAIQPLLVVFNRLTGLATPHPAPVERNPLTRRETEVLQLVSQGFTAHAIGYILRISTSTVRKHVEHSYEKLGQHDRVTAVTAAARLGIIHLPE